MFDEAPLIVTPDAQPPAGGEAAWIVGAGGGRLRTAIWRPEGRARGSVILSGGRTEPIEKYYEVIGEFLERGFVVLAHDWRGQGLSSRFLPDRLKGHAKGYKAFLADFQALLAAYQSQLPKPWVAVGHSMGGCLTLLALAQGETRFAGAVLSAPMLGLQTGATALAKARFAAGLHVLLGRANRYVQGQPGRPFDDDFEANRLTHDRARFARNCGLVAAEPQLALGAPTWGWLDFAFRATAFLAKPEHLRSVTIPVAILSAGEDKLVDNAAQAAAARQLPQGKLIQVPGAYHEILMETDEMRNIFLRVFDALTGRVAPKPAAGPKPTAAAPAPAPKAEAKPAAPPKPAVEPVKPAVAEAPKPAAAPPAAAAAPKAEAKPAAAPKAKAPAKAAAPKTAASKPAASKATAPKTAAAAKKPAAKAAAPKAVKAEAKPAAAKAAKPAAKTEAKAPAKKPTAAKAAAPKAAAKPAAKAAAPKPAAPKAAAAKPAAATAKKPVAAKKPAAKKPALA